MSIMYGLVRFRVPEYPAHIIRQTERTVTVILLSLGGAKTNSGPLA